MRGSALAIRITEPPDLPAALVVLACSRWLCSSRRRWIELLHRLGPSSSFCCLVWWFLICYFVHSCGGSRSDLLFMVVVSAAISLYCCNKSVVVYGGRAAPPFGGLFSSRVRSLWSVVGVRLRCGCAGGEVAVVLSGDAAVVMCGAVLCPFFDG